MSDLPKNILELPLEQRALMALRVAVEKVIEDHARKNLPVYIWSKGKVVAADAKKLRANLRRRRARAARNLK